MLVCIVMYILYIYIVVERITKQWKGWRRRWTKNKWRDKVQSSEHGQFIHTDDVHYNVMNQCVK